MIVWPFSFPICCLAVSSLVVGFMLGHYFVIVIIFNFSGKKMIEFGYGLLPVVSPYKMDHLLDVVVVLTIIPFKLQGV